jgi:hypothetical protein
MGKNDAKTTGGCQCGGVTYELTGDPAVVMQCHCLNCQKSSGTGHVPFAGYPQPQVKVTGKTKGYNYVADSGGTATTNFCPECGSAIFGTTTSFPGIVAIRLGSMDDSTAFKPQMDVYMKRMRSWDKALDGAPHFDAMPPMQK